MIIVRVVGRMISVRVIGRMISVCVVGCVINVRKVELGRHWWHWWHWWLGLVYHGLMSYILMI